MFKLYVSIAFIYYYLCFYNKIYSNIFGIDLYNNPCEIMNTIEFGKNINNPNHQSYTKCISDICTNCQFIGTQILMHTKLPYDV